MGLDIATMDPSELALISSDEFDSIIQVKYDYNIGEMCHRGCKILML